MSMYDGQDRNAFKPIAENPIILDFGNCQYLAEVHLLLKEAFGLPAYYGENWDALWDCLRYMWTQEESVSVEIHRFMTLDKDVREHCAAMFDVFDDVHRVNPWVVFTRVS